MGNIFKILAREDSVKTDNLIKVLSPFGEVEVILDVEGDLEGYTGMTGRWLNHTTAWDLLFKELAEEYTWVVEDDVAFNQETIENILDTFESDESDLISNWIYSRIEKTRWGWWYLGRSLEEAMLWTSLNCFCRISPTLIKKVKEHRDGHGKFLFHEILLPTLSDTRLDFKETQFKDYFNNFHWDKSEVDLESVSEYAHRNLLLVLVWRKS